jgi:hypothetical protein
VQKDALQILGREDGGEERKIEKNGGNFWGRPRPGRGCSAMDGWMDGLWLHHIFPHYLINGTIIGRKLLNIECVFWFSLQICLKYFSS